MIYYSALWHASYQLAFLCYFQILLNIHMKSQAQLHAESKCATKEVITIFQNEEVNKGWQRNKSIQKYLQITKMKILPAMAIGVKKIHAKYFLDQMCSVLVIQLLRLKNVIFLFRRQILLLLSSPIVWVYQTCSPTVKWVTMWHSSWARKQKAKFCTN